MNQKWNWITQIALEEKWRGLEPTPTKKLSRLTIAELKERLTIIRNATGRPEPGEAVSIQTAKV
jgi:hypothetical protein